MLKVKANLSCLSRKKGSSLSWILFLLQISALYEDKFKSEGTFEF